MRVVVMAVACAAILAGAAWGERAPGGKRILIASEKSEFKQALVDALVTKLKAEGRQTTSVKLGDVSEAGPGDYDAIVIINSVPEWSKTRTVPKLVDSVGKLVIVTTSRKGTWKPKGVDAITTASAKVSINRVLSGVNKRLISIIGKPESSPGT